MKKNVGKNTKPLQIGLLFKPGLREIEHIFDQLNGFEQKKVSFGVVDRVSQHNHHSELRTPNSKFDFILSLGGDGTILRSVEYAVKYDAPVLGFNLGKLGFLTDSTLKELKTSINALMNGKYRLESRMLLDVRVMQNSSQLSTINYQLSTALNDIVLFKRSDAKLVNLRLYANKQFVYETRSDGIIVSSPTGSTAYNLSAGGPIISPDMSAIIVTPLNPHILSVRPMVFDKDDTIEIKIPSHSGVHLQIDGANKCDLADGDRIIVKKSKEIIRFVKLSHKTFYKVLRQKLKMGSI